MLVRRQVRMTLNTQDQELRRRWRSSALGASPQVRDVDVSSVLHAHCHQEPSILCTYQHHPSMHHPPVNHPTPVTQNLCVLISSEGNQLPPLDDNPPYQIRQNISLSMGYSKISPTSEGDSVNCKLGSDLATSDYPSWSQHQGYSRW